MKWVTRPGVHIDRTACCWLIRRFIDSNAEFAFAPEVGAAPAGARTFDMRGGEFSHRGGNCSFETLLEEFELTDPALDALARIVHEADLEDERYDAPEARGLDVVIRGLSSRLSDERTIEIANEIYDGLYEHLSRASTGDA